MPSIFIDGAAGTTGMMIGRLLKPLEDQGFLHVITIENPRDREQRGDAFARADLVVLCLPDDGAREAMELLEGTAARVLDASAAHRLDAGWVYGLPELSAAQPEAIRQARRVANPGCFATGAIAILRPLIAAGLIDPEHIVTVSGVSGYSGGGKKMIARYEAGQDNGNGNGNGNEDSLSRIFSLHSREARHRHVQEIQAHSGLSHPPLFLPQIIDTPRGMMVTVAFNAAAVHGTVDDVRAAYDAAYAYPGSKIHLAPADDAGRTLDFSRFASINREGAAATPVENLELHVAAWSEDGEGQITVCALLDNLGKGAGTQAVQNIRLMLDI